MCIYCDTNKYRNIYQEHFGEIPKDELGEHMKFITQTVTALTIL